MLLLAAYDGDLRCFKSVLLPRSLLVTPLPLGPRGSGPCLIALLILGTAGLLARAELLMSLDKRSGRLREKVEAVKVEAEGVLKGAGALHIAAGNGRLEICSYLVEGLRVDVDAVDSEGQTLFSQLNHSFVEHFTFNFVNFHGVVR